MAYTVKYFMWGYQEHFIRKIENLARNTFKQLDADIACRAFVVGFLEGQIAGRLQVCIAPDECIYTPDDFADTRSRATELAKEDPENRVSHTHEKLQRIHRDKIAGRGLMNAVRESINKRIDSKDWSTFLSFPTRLAGYALVVALQVDRSSHANYYALSKATAGDDDTGQFKISRSLIEACSDQVLSAAVKELKEEDPGFGLATEIKSYEVLQRAARSMMDAATIAGRSFDAMHGQFELCCAISTLTYEGADAAGKLVYAQKGHASVSTVIELATPVVMSDHRGIRKLLELCTDDLAIICDASHVYAIGSTNKTYDNTREDLFEVHFSKPFCWRLSHDGETLMSVLYGEPQLQRSILDEDTLRDVAERIFDGISATQLGRIVQLARYLVNQKNGAMLVISKNAPEEIERLANQCLPVSPFCITQDTMAQLARIDGAVVADIDGVCHGIGVILDGESHRNCTASRGARYNSAVRYVYGQENCLAIVKSEDGMIDLVPTLRPRIRRSEVDKHLDELTAFSRQSHVSRRAYSVLMRWLDTHRFFLRDDDCRVVNELWPLAEKGLEHQEMLLRYAEFRPHVDMNESYYLAEEAGPTS